MPKRKRKELTETVTALRADGKKKVNDRHQPKAENAVAEAPKSELQSSLASDDFLPTTSTPRGIRIITGSYEKVLCGIDARFSTQATEKVFLTSYYVND
jgi:hypothetical protein